jgi:hypothetical protein
MEKRTNEEKESKNTEGREMWLDETTLKEVSSDTTSDNNKDK